MNVFDVLREKLNKKTVERYGNEGMGGQMVVALDDINETINQVEQEHNSGWIPADQPPKDDSPVLLSFANFSVPLVGRYEEDENGGAYYVGDEDVPLVQQDIFVNAWMPLPEQYREDTVPRMQTNADRIRSMTDEELADALLKINEISDHIPFCGNNTECNEIMDKGEWISSDMCKKCMMEWLGKEVDA